MSVQNFGALGVPADLATRLEASGIVEPSAIQAAVIPDALAGRDVTGRAPTGSGKTLAFGLPLVTNLAPAQRRRPTALVLAPTRELAQQIADVLRPLARGRRHDVVAVYGGVGYGPQRKALDAGAELVVACPGRLEDLVSMGAVSLADVGQVVIDEADRMADMGFLPAVRRLIDQTRSDRQVMLFSATLDGAVGKLAAAVQRRPARHEVGPAGPDVTMARHLFWAVDRADRPRQTAAVATALGATLVFCRTRHGADRLATQLTRLGVTAAPIHGGRSQPQRDRALRAFAARTATVLVATDVAARGVHVDEVAAVVHYDPPADAATYVHRSGRTARAGHSGVVVSLVELGAERDARALQGQVGVDVPVRRPQIADLGAPERAVRATAEPVGDRRVGTVTFFHDRRGYGFIDGGSDGDVFIHHTNLTSTIKRGQRVEYDTREGRRGPEAFDVIAV
ncbi:MAG TPA: DEAD/DEAH box helicase [Ilumatobacteraceae bacterium]|nr:DEAD/DEAH box helicase [Ilumatobacteraceae bacterium]